MLDFILDMFDVYTGFLDMLDIYTSFLDMLDVYIGFFLVCTGFRYDLGYYKGFFPCVYRYLCAGFSYTEFFFPYLDKVFSLFHVNC